MILFVFIDEDVHVVVQLKNSQIMPHKQAQEQPNQSTTLVQSSGKLTVINAISADLSYNLIQLSG